MSCRLNKNGKPIDQVGHDYLLVQVRRTCVQHCRSESVWNSLPADPRATVNTGIFKKKLKTFYLANFIEFPTLNFYYVVLVVIGRPLLSCRLSLSLSLS